MANIENTITLAMEDRVKLFEGDAKKYAKMVCGFGECFCTHYKCGHENVLPIGIPRIGSDETCPIAKYEVTPDKRSWFERIDEQITLYGSFSICACCENAEVTQTTDEYVVTYKNLEAHCLDCPVHMAKEHIEENMAEANMS